MTPRAADLVAELTRVTAAAARANVTIYAFDPRGLDLHMGAELLATGVSPSTQLQQRRRLSAEMLRSLAEETGGAAAIDTNDARPGALDARRQREQPLLPDRLRADRRGARRALPVDRRAREAAGPPRQRPQGLRRAGRQRAAAARASAGSARSCPSWCAGRCRRSACRSSVMAVPLPIEFDNVTRDGRESGAQAHRLRRARRPAREHRRSGHRAGRHRRQGLPAGQRPRAAVAAAGRRRGGPLARPAHGRAPDAAGRHLPAARRGARGAARHVRVGDLRPRRARSLGAAAWR